MKLGILKTDDVRPEWVQEHGEYPDMFAALLQSVNPALEIEVFDVLRDQYPVSIDQVDAYLITGSKFSAYDDEPWIHKLVDFVRRLSEARKKLVGICFGHQLIAHALGGRVEKSAKGWGLGRHTVTLTGKASHYGREGTPFSILVSHQDQVTVAATGADILAGSAFCPIAMCRLGDHILSFQGHPEFLPAYARALLALRRDIHGERRYRQAVDSLKLPLDRQQLARWIMDFMSAC